MYRNNFDNLLTSARKFLDTLHTEYPNAKVKMLGIQIPNTYDAHGYGADGDLNAGSYSDTYGLAMTAFALNDAYQELANSNEYKEFVEFINVSSQFDSEYNSQNTEKDVNTRNSAKEIICNNVVHPSYEGYMQIADVAYRCLCASL